MRRLASLLSAVVVLATALTPLSVADATAPALSQPGSAVAAGSLRVGGETLRRCNLGIGAPGSGRATWCGSLAVPLDPTDPHAGTIRIGFGWLPARRRATGTVVAQEGGPGYPSTGTAADFAAMFGPLLERRNLLVVDARGTGRSTPIDCEPLQSLPSPSPRFTRAVTACGQQLNHTFRRAGGGYVHASDLFTTADSARDLARVIRSLRVGRVDLYGDSYGTYFAQSFLARYPGLLRSVVLDSAYEARDLDPWYRTTVTTARAAFDKVCARAVACAPGSSWARIGRLARLLRAHPVSGRVPSTAGGLVDVRVDVTALVNMVNDAGYDTEPYRQLDAAARAYLGHRDAVPLERLYAQDIGWDYSDYSAPAAYYSDGLYMAVACTDYPQLFSMRAGAATRRAQLAARVRRLPRATFAPFTTAEWLSVLPYTETYTGCLNWPAPTHPADPPVPPRQPMDATDVPVLILNGELDSLTPAPGGAHIARQLGDREVRGHPTGPATTVVAANNVHLVALYDSHECGSVLVRRFIAEPRRRLDTACAQRLPAIRAVPRFPRTLTDTLPATGAASLLDRRLAAVAVGAAGDAVNRFPILDGSTDRGLRGGAVDYGAGTGTNGEDVVAVLHRVRWTVDTTVTGRVWFATDAGGATATLTVSAPGAVSRLVHLAWTPRRYATVRIDSVVLTVAAP